MTSPPSCSPLVHGGLQEGDTAFNQPSPEFQGDEIIMEGLIFKVCGGGFAGLIALLGIWSAVYIASGRAHLDSRLRSVSR